MENLDKSGGPHSLYSQGPTYDGSKPKMQTKTGN